MVSYNNKLRRVCMMDADNVDMSRICNVRNLEYAPTPYYKDSFVTLYHGDCLELLETLPAADLVLTDPPFLVMSPCCDILCCDALGADYLAWLKDAYKCGIQDLCIYWFRKASDHLGANGRAGLIGTNSISQNKARAAGLDYVVKSGGVITSAISTQKWPGDAKVHVSIVNWIKSPDPLPTRFVLDDQPIQTGITASLQPDVGLAQAVVLSANTGRAFQGPIPVGEGFILTRAEARTLLARTDANYGDVVKPYLIGEDIANDHDQQPSRWIIDFGSMPLEEAQRYPTALGIVQERVKPERERNNDRRFREIWWRFGRQRNEMRKAIAELSRYISGTATGKRLLLTWCDSHWCPSNSTNVFAFDDDYSFGILSSRIHTAWARHMSSTLKGDLRYTPTTAFATFPWPYPVEDARRNAVAEYAVELVAMRKSLCAEFDVGLTKLYNTMDQGGHRSLRALHQQLDEAVARCYGWPHEVAENDRELIARLSSLNAEIADGKRYLPFPKLYDHDDKHGGRRLL
jgi:hypothetical protein